MNERSDHGAGSAVEQVRRWEQAGGAWRVLGRRGDAVTVALLRCDAGEEIDRLSSDDPELLAHLGSRTASDD